MRPAEIRETGQICGLRHSTSISTIWLAEPTNDGSNAMPPTDLNVPFHEKDDAKRLGARWDAVRKTWFLPDCTDPAPFAKWLPQHSDINLRCTSYFIAQSVRACWHCDRDSHVFSFLLPRGHQTWQDSDESAGWEPQESEAIIYYITQIPERVQVQMRSVTGHYRNNFSKTTQSFYWMNHCEHCGMKQGDFELFEEFDTPSQPPRWGTPEAKRRRRSALRVKNYSAELLLCAEVGRRMSREIALSNEHRDGGGIVIRTRLVR